jgi:hypothetical protein
MYLVGAKNTNKRLRFNMCICALRCNVNLSLIFIIVG